MSEFKSWNSYRHFANRVRHQARFNRTPEDDEFLLEVMRTSESRIRQLPEEFGLWRAQLGHTWRPLRQDGRHVDDIPAAYRPERMRPLEHRATEGRVNPKGIPVLYLSTRRETAMSEVRPWLGSHVSCAHFKTTRALRIVDFSVHHGSGFIIHFNEPNAAEREQSVWTQIDHAFSEPMTSQDDTADYVPTQVIAELFKREGFDGIVYKSAFGDDGYNIALFNLDHAKLISCCLYEVESAEFSFKETDNPYWVDEDGILKTLSIKVVAPESSLDDSGQ